MPARQIDLTRMRQPLCFVLMPSGRKRDPGGGADIDFDRVYERAIRPAIVEMKLDPVRADEEVTAGVIHKTMFERLLLCEFAVADLTTANANVFYELGVRHAARPQTTLTLYAREQPIPFDVNLLRALPYNLGSHNSFGDAEATTLRQSLAKRLEEVRDLAFRQEASDSPLVQLLQGYRCPDLAHLRTDVFRDQVEFSELLKKKLRDARGKKPHALAEQELVAVEQSLTPLDGGGAGVLVDLFLSYRALGAFDRMISLFDRLPQVLRQTVLVREQLAFALNRKAGQVGTDQREQLRDQALRLLEEIITERGANGETCGLLGRIFKDRWDEARKMGDDVRAGGLHRRAIREYTRGFEADWRDAYPGINAVTLLDLEGSPPSLTERDRLLPVVRYAVEQKLRGSKPDYWDHATLVELSVLASQPHRAEDHLANALASLREPWEAETTARNLALLTEARTKRGEDTAWIVGLSRALEAAANARRGD
jgi:hypothetical protein